MRMSGQLHAPVVLPLGKEPRYPLNKRLSGLHNRSGCGGEGKEFLPLSGMELSRPVHSLGSVLSCGVLNRNPVIVMTRIYGNSSVDI